MRARGSDIRVARVLHEDEAFMTVEISKDDSRELRIEDGDRFFTLMFVRRKNGSKDMEAWTPWDK